MSRERGIVTGSILGNTATKLTVSRFGEVVDQTATLSGNALYKETIVARDAPGRIQQRNEAIGTATPRGFNYTYDVRGRISHVESANMPVAAYAYDANRNRIRYTTPLGSVVGRCDPRDGLTRYCSENSSGTISAASGLPCFAYTYRESGELQTKVDLVSNATTELRYDGLGQLQSVRLPNGSTVTYENDARGRRVGKSFDGTKRLGLLALRPIALLDADNAVVATFVYADAMTAPRFMMRGGQTYRYIVDHIGSVRMVVNAATGTTAQLIDYDEFGRVLVDTNPGFQPFGFAGGLYDTDTGLVRFGARDYDAGVGRWTAKDPVLFARRDTNLYLYVHGDPINHIDPTGLYTEITIWDPVGDGESSFGHVSVDVNGTACSLGPGGMHDEPATYYEQRNEQFRGGTVYSLDLSPELEEALDRYLRRPQGDYNILQNNCGDPLERFIRGAFGTGRGDSADKLTPAALGGLLQRSGLLDGTRRVESWNP